MTALPTPPQPGQPPVLNLPEMRMYYYPPKKAGQPMQVQTYPISIGRMAIHRRLTPSAIEMPISRRV